MKRIVIISAALLLAGGFSGCVTQQDLYPYDERLYRLEQQVQQQNSELEKSRDRFSRELSTYKNDAQQSRNQSASLTAILDGMRQETRQLKGQLEELEYRLNQELGISGQAETRYSQRVEQLEASMAETKKRIEYVENYLNLERPDAKNAKATGEQKPATGQPFTETELYLKAKEAFDSGDDETAREKFKTLLKQYPKSKNADNAQFWIAEIFYREQWFEKAILEYNKVIENYPKGNKAPDAMLKQGLAFYKLGDKANARVMLKECIRKYPKSHASQIARKKLKGF